METPPPAEVKVKNKGGAKKGQLTDAQKASLKKGFDALKAKRDALRAQKEAKLAEAPVVVPSAVPTDGSPQKELVEVKEPVKRKHDRKQILPEHLFKLKDEIGKELNDFKQVIAPLNEYIENKKKKKECVQPQPQQIVITPAPPVITKLTNSELLNKIFFNR